MKFLTKKGQNMCVKKLCYMNSYRLFNAKTMYMYSFSIFNNKIDFRAINNQKKASQGDRIFVNEQTIPQF